VAVGSQQLIFVWAVAGATKIKRVSVIMLINFMAVGLFKVNKNMQGSLF